MRSLLLFSLVFTTLSSGAIPLVDDGLSPVERAQAGQPIRRGAYLAYDPLHCSQNARVSYLPQALREQSLISIRNGQTMQSVGTTLAGIRTKLNELYDLLNSEMLDVNALNYHLCIGMYNDATALHGNAISIGMGYIVFDYRLFQHLYNLPDHRRSSWIFDYVIYHEFAHQLQFWSNDAEVLLKLNNPKTVNSRVIELAADCTAGALLRIKNNQLALRSPTLYNLSIRGPMEAASEIGNYDFANLDFHGTPEERNASVKFGADMAAAHYDLFKSFRNLDSRVIIRRCNSFVRNTLK